MSLPLPPCIEVRRGKMSAYRLACYSTLKSSWHSLLRTTDLKQLCLINSENKIRCGTYIATKYRKVTQNSAYHRLPKSTSLKICVCFVVLISSEKYSSLGDRQPPPREPEYGTQRHFTWHVCLWVDSREGSKSTLTWQGLGHLMAPTPSTPAQQHLLSQGCRCFWHSA